MFNEDEDDDVPVDTEPDVEPDLSDADAVEDDEEPAAPAAKAKRAAARKPATAKPAKTSPRTPPVRDARAKAAAKAPKKKLVPPPPKKKRAAKRTAAKRAARTATPPPDLTGVKAGAHTLWVSADLAGVLTSKDQRKLKALLKRAEKRGKSKKK